MRIVVTRRRVAWGTVAILVAWAALEYVPVGVAVRRIVAPMYAKELCSCLFVVGQTADYCMPYVRHDLSALDRIPLVDTSDAATIDRDDESVTVTLLFNEATASHVDDRLGCRLDP